MMAIVINIITNNFDASIYRLAYDPEFLMASYTSSLLAALHEPAYAGRSMPSILGGF